MAILLLYPCAKVMKRKGVCKKLKTIAEMLEHGTTKG